MENNNKPSNKAPNKTMKQRFIILSLLLLSSPMIGMEPIVIYQYKISSGCIWETFRNDKIQPKYKGEIKNGKMDGLGILTLSIWREKYNRRLERGKGMEHEIYRLR